MKAPPSSSSSSSSSSSQKIYIQKSRPISSKLNVDVLHVRLSTRGLDTAGTKPTLVRRMDVNLRKERKEDEASSASNAGKKRSRDEPEVGDEIERLREMSVSELRELASLRGLPVHGSKRELVERLFADAEMGSEEVLEGKEIEGSKKEKLITAAKKGGAVLDQRLPDHIMSNYHVLQQYDTETSPPPVAAPSTSHQGMAAGWAEASSVRLDDDQLRRIADMIIDGLSARVQCSGITQADLAQLTTQFETVVGELAGISEILVGISEILVEISEMLARISEILTALEQIQLDFSVFSTVQIDALSSVLDSLRQLLAQLESRGARPSTRAGRHESPSEPSS